MPYFTCKRLLAIFILTIHGVPEDTVLGADVTLEREDKDEQGSSITVSSGRVLMAVSSLLTHTVLFS